VTLLDDPPPPAADAPELEPRVDSTAWWLRVLASRGPLTRIALFVLTVLGALVAAAPLIMIAGANPIDAYVALFQGSLGSKRGIAETLIAATPLLVCGLAVSVSFQGGLFNIGVEGQLVVGGLAAGGIGAKMSLPAGIHVIVAILGAAAAGALWALVPALLKAFRGVHEVITTIMLNYVAFSLSTYLVSPGGPLVSSTQPSATDKVRSTAKLARIWEPTRLHLGVVVAVGLCAACWWFLFRTTAGYRLRMVGANPQAARFNGIDVRAVTVRTLCLSGALAGCAGAIEVLGLHGRYFDSFSPGYGFDSIAVALLGLMNPIGVAAAAAFFGLLRAGSVLLQAQAGVSKDMVTTISGLVVAFVAARVVIERWMDRRSAARPGRSTPDE
jgi:simple sugar transport system permease protein